MFAKQRRKSKEPSNTNTTGQNNFCCPEWCSVVFVFLPLSFSLYPTLVEFFREEEGRNNAQQLNERLNTRVRFDTDFSRRYWIVGKTAFFFFFIFVVVVVALIYHPWCPVIWIKLLNMYFSYMWRWIKLFQFLFMRCRWCRISTADIPIIFRSVAGARPEIIR